ncbi:GNAT family N-acetyltransferase [Cronobacter dublinensis]|uniref:GNAT family N-acetyltransferase n=1 Tax=Cronobacter dublinensis TaxID=413497 RepID=UPI000CFB2700|nr:GNAT family N-acetyltransferase [Cronobacter dublinensis]
MAFRIRKTAAEDIAWLEDVECSADSAFAAIPALAWVATDGAQPQALHYQLLATGYCAVAVDDADTPVGFINGEYIADELHILGVAVARDYQGNGLGKMLIAGAIGDARDRHLAALTLTTFRDVPWNRPFYERLGFRVIADDALSVRLTRLLEEEAAHGFCRSDRCAMRLTLSLPGGA